MGGGLNNGSCCNFGFFLVVVWLGWKLLSSFTFLFLFLVGEHSTTQITGTPKLPQLKASPWQMGSHILSINC